MAPLYWNLIDPDFVIRGVGVGVDARAGALVAGDDTGCVAGCVPELEDVAWRFLTAGDREVDGDGEVADTVATARAVGFGGSKEEAWLEPLVASGMAIDAPTITAAAEPSSNGRRPRWCRWTWPPSPDDAAVAGATTDGSGDRSGATRAGAGQQVAGREPLAGILDQAALDERAEFVRHSVQLGGGMNDPVDERCGRAAAERCLTACREGQHRAQAEDVARRADLAAFGLFGRHEARRADHEARPRHRGRLGRPGDPEVDHTRPVLGQQHVGGLQVTVHDTGGVDRGQAFCQPGGQREDRGDGQRPVVVKRPLTFRAAATSRRNRTRKSGSAASSLRMTFTATRRPPADRPRNTRPMPPLPSCPTSL